MIESANPPMPWMKMRLRDAEVFARVDDGGKPLAKGGRVEIRYNARASKAYQAGVGNLTAVAGAQLLPDEFCGDAPDDGAPGGTGSSPSAARPRTGAARPGTRGKTAKPGDQPPAVEAGTVIVYADGACSGNPGPAGLGIVVIDGTTRIERSEYLGHATNNVAELTAVLRALETVDDKNRPMAIHTDSQYSIGVLSLGWKAKSNQELIGEIRAELKGRPHVRFVHVRGHAGVPLNERADELATQAVSARKTVEHVIEMKTAVTAPTSRA